MDELVVGFSLLCVLFFFFFFFFFQAEDGIRDADVTGVQTCALPILDEGARLVGHLRGRARLAVAGYVGGGRAALDAIAAAGYDVLPGAPRARRIHRLRRTLH